MKFKNAIEHRQHDIMYELVVDMGDDGTATIFRHHKQDVVNYMLDKFMIGEYDGMDIDEDIAKDVVGISVQLTIEAPKGTISIINYEDLEQVMVELFSCEVEQ